MRLEYIRTSVQVVFFSKTCEDVSIIVDTASKTLEPVSLQDYMKDLTSSGLNFSMPGTKRWTFVHCAADFSSSGVANHWVPVVSANAIGENLYNSLVKLQECEADLAVTTLQSEYMNMDVKYQEAVNGQCSASRLKTLEAQLSTAESAWLGAVNWCDFCARCKKIDMLPFKVPADGNCLLWSVKVLDSQEYSELAWEQSKENLAEVQELRETLSRSWISLSDWRWWQELFAVYFGISAEVEAGSCTPKPKEKVSADPKTPPEKPKVAKKKAKMVENCSRAPAWTAFQDERTPHLMKPPTGESGSQKDHEAKPKGSNSKQKRARKEKEKDEEENADVELPEIYEEEMPEEEREPATHASKHNRSCKKKPKTKKERRLKGIRRYLASIGVCYPEWQSSHWHHCGSKKAGKWDLDRLADQAHDIPTYEQAAGWAPVQSLPEPLVKVFLRLCGRRPAHGRGGSAADAERRRESCCGEGDISASVGGC